MEELEQKNAIGKLKELIECLHKMENHKDIEAQFFKIADLLMNHMSINANNILFRIFECEFYYFNSNHQDPYVHRSLRQKLFGEWYFHYYRDSNSYINPRFNRKGVDLTLGSDTNYLGVVNK